MVLGLRTKSRKSVSVQVDYLIRVQEIKPWPPSDSLKSVQSVLLQWQNGDESSGSFTSTVIGDGKIEFSETFRLPVILFREASKKSASRDNFQKSWLEINLYDYRKEKTVKNQLLGSAVINLADYAIIRDPITLSIPVNFKRSSKNWAQPVLYINVQPFDKDSCSSSPKVSFSKEVSLEKDEEEAEIASFTDDDESSSHSSQTITSIAARSSPTGSEKKGIESAWNGMEKILKEQHTGSLGTMSVGPNRTRLDEAFKHPNSSSSIAKVSHSQTIEEEASTRKWTTTKEDPEKSMPHSLTVGITEDKETKEQQEDGKETTLEAKKHSIDKVAHKFPQEAFRKQVKLRSDTLEPSRNTLGIQGNVPKNDKLKHLKSLQLNSNSSDSNELLISNQVINQTKKTVVLKNHGAINSSTSENRDSSQVTYQDKKIDILKGTCSGTLSHATSEDKVKTEEICESKTGLESKVEMLQEELREAAAVEVALYSVVADHGSSVNKVHAPARRLSRFYFHASKAKSSSTMASAARTVVSGLLLVSKACGNDVPRLTFWLSNTILLRAIVSQAAEKTKISLGINIKSNATENFDDWEETQALIVALEKVEAQIFTRIVESVWWQTLTPYVQFAAAKGSSSRKANGKRNGLGDHDQGNFSIDLWKKAFKDASERLCPLRAGGHECGCLPVTARLVVEQLVSRLDVAMFNAILRESYEEMPMDPVSDPITDRKVLPIPAGKSSFGAGAQLKNAIGSWSRWLTDLFGIDDSEYPLDGTEHNDDKKPGCEESFKPFGLLNALSDLMMLPFEMLGEQSTRKEVCPIFGVPLIKRVINNFVPDEFCPTPIPNTILNALDSEDINEAEEESLTNFPCSAVPTIYSPPPAPSLTSIIGEVGSHQTLLRSGSSVLRKSYTSDDELDELDLSISEVFNDKSHVSPTSNDSSSLPKGKGGRKVVRYQLLREIWRDQ